ncbi:hypothetical protein ACIOTI_23380 [Streptomyces sp. NPDC087843]|uniref:hypothetical protein n=1 Tax=Streptomyces sp. NPDC087843 TaxID=3365804 RepID=UPI003821100B
MSDTGTGGGSGGATVMHADICARLDQIRDVVPADRGAELEEILASLRDGGDPVAPQAELHLLLRRSGVAAGLRAFRGAGIGGLPAAVEGHPVVEAYVCPRERCDRRSPARNQPAPPVCWLYGEPLCRRRVS